MWVLATVAGAAIFLNTAQAVPVMYEFSGEFELVSPELDALGIRAGLDFSGRFGYDPEAAPIAVSTRFSHAIYEGLLFNARIGSTGSIWVPDSNISVVDDFLPNAPQDSFEIEAHGSPMQAGLTGFQVFSVTAGFVDSSATLFNSYRLPAELSLEMFDWTNFGISGYIDGLEGGFGADGRITSLRRVSVPEPDPARLLITTILMLVVAVLAQRHPGRLLRRPISSRI